MLFYQCATDCVNLPLLRKTKIIIDLNRLLEVLNYIFFADNLQTNSSTQAPAFQIVSIL
jgi:hypothetical protein